MLELTAYVGLGRKWVYLILNSSPVPFKALGTQPPWPNIPFLVSEFSFSFLETNSRPDSQQLLSDPLLPRTWNRKFPEPSPLDGWFLAFLWVGFFFSSKCSFWSFLVLHLWPPGLPCRDARRGAVADCMTALLSLPCDLQPEFLSLIPSSWACRTLSRPQLLYSLWTWKSHCRKPCYYSNRIRLPESKTWPLLTMVLCTQMSRTLSNDDISNSCLRSLTSN